MGQLNLFAQAPKVLNLRAPDSRRFSSPFDRALFLDEEGDRLAADWYRRAIAERDSAADAWCNLGIIESDAGHRDRAFDCLTKALASDPRHFEAHFNLGNLYFDTGEYRLARLHYHLASAIDPGFADLHYNLCLVETLEERPTEALEAMQRYMDLAGPDQHEHTAQLLEELRAMKEGPGDGAL
jgi:tetratricopeptide (TPR) repeat protein